MLSLLYVFVCRIEDYFEHLLIEAVGTVAHNSLYVSLSQIVISKEMNMLLRKLHI